MAALSHDMHLTLNSTKFNFTPSYLSPVVTWFCINNKGFVSLFLLLFLSTIPKKKFFSRRKLQSNINFATINAKRSLSCNHCTLRFSSMKIQIIKKEKWIQKLIMIKWKTILFIKVLNQPPLNKNIELIKKAKALIIISHLQMKKKT